VTVATAAKEEEEAPEHFIAKEEMVALEAMQATEVTAEMEEL
jgi:hypothetical protein